MVEVVITAAITSLAIAASAAAVSAASDSRSATLERSTAAEIANEALQRAEAFGCGLPDPYLGVAASARAAGCAAISGTMSRRRHTFSVSLSHRWHLPEALPADYAVSADECENRAAYAAGAPSRPPAASDPPARGVPTLLERTVTVTPSGRASRPITITSLQSTLPALAPSGWACR